MNINSRINWQVGLELTEQTFKGNDLALEARISALRSALHSGQFGLLPDSTYYSNPTFVKRSLEIANLRCKALLRTGDILHIDESVEVPISMLYEDTYYVVASLDNENLIHFDYKGVPMVRPSHKFSVATPEHLAKDLNLFPIVKLRQENGTFQIDTNYVPPVVCLGSSEKLTELLVQIIKSVEAIVSHPNLEPGEATLSLRRLLFKLKAINERSLLSDVISRLVQLSEALDYYVCAPNSLQKPQVNLSLDLNDVEPWFSSISEVFKWAEGAMAGVVLEDKSVDYEKLKSELYEQLSRMVKDDLFKQMYDKLSSELREEIARDVKAPLMNFINGQVRKELYADLFSQLVKDLDLKLSSELYQKLYDALYVEEQQTEEEFVPLM